MSSSIYEQVCSILNGKQTVNRHSFFQLRYFLVGKEPTHQARLWRCVRELEVRKATLEGLDTELEDIQDKLALLEIEVERQTKGKLYSSSDLDKREGEIKLRRLYRKKKSLKTAIQSNRKRKEETEQEAAFLATAYLKLEEQEPLKPYDDLDSQMEFWNAKVSQEIQIRQLMGVAIDPELVKTTLALDDRMPVKQELTGALAFAQRMIEQKKEALQIDTNKQTEKQ
jgi:hypothetical protein